MLTTYTELEKEGILYRERSSGTFLQPFIPEPRNRVHGVVGFPIWSYGYCHFSDWRYFFRQMDEQLRKRHYVANLIFARDTEALDAAFLDRLLEHRLDWLIWYLPLPCHKMLLQKLQDNGVRIIVIPEANIYLPFPTYHISYHRAIMKGIQQWKNKGIEHVVFFVINEGDALCYCSLYLSQLKALGMNSTMMNLNRHDLVHFFNQQYAPQRTAILFSCMDISGKLSVSQLNEFLLLLSKYRVMIPGHIELEANYLEGLQADMVSADWVVLTEKIVKNLSSGKIFRTQPPQTFDVEYHESANLADFAIKY